MSKFQYLASIFADLVRYGLYGTIHFQLALLFGWKVTGKTYQLLFPVWPFHNGAVFTLCDINWNTKRFSWFLIERKNKVNLYSSDNKTGFHK